MRATAIESVNAPRLSSIVVCERTSVELDAD
jgi:hypothetical protein